MDDAQRAEFTERCRRFLAQATLPGMPQTMAEAKQFQAALTDAGLAGLAYAASTAAPG